MPEFGLFFIFISLFGGYLCGCFNTAFLLAKIKKVNIMESGSKNPGASNAMVTMGWKAGVLVGLVDILKCAIPVFLAGHLLPIMPELRFFAALGAILGHMFPFYLKFKGGHHGDRVYHVNIIESCGTCHLSAVYKVYNGFSLFFSQIEMNVTRSLNVREFPVYGEFIH